MRAELQTSRPAWSPRDPTARVAICPRRRSSHVLSVIMSEFPPCPKCGSEYTYPDGAMLMCPMCAHEWSADAPPPEDEADAGPVYRDSVGNVLQDGDDVVVVKTMKVKGAPTALKAGTKVKNIRLVEGDHDIDCNIPGFGAMKLKTSIVKKA